MRLTSVSNSLTLFLILSVFTFMAGCHKKSARAPETEESPQPVTLAKATTAPSDTFKIIVSNGGGITGLFNGYTLHPHGLVTHWQRWAAGPDSVLWTVNADSAQIQSFRQELLASGMLEKSMQQTGNMTTSVTLELPAREYIWSWGDTRAFDSATPAFKEWYRRVETFCRSLKK
ncbi:MAG TPA: hypothetical protein VGA99_00920 [bacterium]